MNEFVVLDDETSVAADIVIVPGLQFYTASDNTPCVDRLHVF
jgi:hypothetical protein